MVPVHLEIDPMRILPVILAIALLGLAACSSTGSLTYTPTVPVTPGPPSSMSAVTAVDRRDEKPNRFATVRGGYGNPAYVRDAPRPVSEEVAAVFTEALRTRGMLAALGNAPYRIQLTLHTFYGNQYLSRNAYIDLDLIITDPSGRELYRDTVKDERSELEIFSISIDKLQALVQALLNATVDRMLDNPKLRAVLGGSPNRPGLPST